MGSGVYQKWSQLSWEFRKEQVWGWKLSSYQVEFGDFVGHPFSSGRRTVLCFANFPLFKARLMPPHFQEVLSESYNPFSSLSNIIPGIYWDLFESNQNWTIKASFHLIPLET